MPIYYHMNEALGLALDESPYLQPKGKCINLKNVECRFKGSYVKRRGFTDADGITGLNVIYGYIDSLFGRNPLLSTIIESGGSLSSWSRTSVNTGLSGVASDLAYYADLGDSALASNNLYLCCSGGIFVGEPFHSTTGVNGLKMRLAGMPKGKYAELTIVDVTGNWLPTTYTTSYRHVWVYVDEKGQEVVSAPSERRDITNSAGADRSVQLDIIIPEEVKVIAADTYLGTVFLRVYRATAVVGIPIEDYKLCYETSTIPTGASDTFLSFNDILPESFRGAELYTNPTQQGLINANERPPASASITEYKDYLIYSNIEDRHKLFTNLISVTNLTGGTSTLTFADGSNTITLGFQADNSGKAITGCANNGSGRIRVTSAGHGYTTGEYVKISGVVGTTEANGIWVITVIDAANFDLDGSIFANAYTSGGNIDLYEDFGATPRAIIYAGGTTSENVDSTARSIVRALSAMSGTDNDWLDAYYVSALDAPPGQIRFDSRFPGQDQFYIIANSTATGGNFSPAIPTSGTTCSSNNNQYANAYMWSKFQAPEHVPAANIGFVGSRNDKILRGEAISDAVFFIKEREGVHQLTGDYPVDFTINVIDTTIEFDSVNINAIVRGDNSIFAYSSQGFVIINNLGIGRISAPNDEYFRFYHYASSSGSKSLRGFFSEAYKTYYVQNFEVIPVVGHVYNVTTGAWSKKDVTVFNIDDLFTNPALGVILTGTELNGLLYYIDRNNNLLVENKTIPVSGTESYLYNNRDFHDWDTDYFAVSNTISSKSVPDSTVTLGGIATQDLVAGTLLEDSSGNQVIIRDGYYVNGLSTTYTVYGDLDSISGSVVAYNAIESYVKYLNIDCGMPGVEKTFKSITFYFNKQLDNDWASAGNDSSATYEKRNELVSTLVSNFRIRTKTDLDDTYRDMYYLEEYPTDGIVRKKLDYFRTELNKEHSVGTWISVEFKHINAFEYFSLCGISIEYDPISEVTARG